MTSRSWMSPKCQLGFTLHTGRRHSWKLVCCNGHSGGMYENNRSHIYYVIADSYTLPSSMKYADVNDFCHHWFRSCEFPFQLPTQTVNQCWLSLIKLHRNIESDLYKILKHCHQKYSQILLYIKSIKRNVLFTIEHAVYLKLYKIHMMKRYHSLKSCHEIIYI